MTETASSPSSEAESLGWRASLGLVALGAIVTVLIGALIGVAPPVQTWLYLQSALDLPARLVAITHFIWAAVGEEIAKALGAVSARLNSNRLSWWGVAALIGASFGLLERMLYLMNWTPEFLALFTPVESLAYDTLAVVAHAAMCVLSVALARALGGGLVGWSIGIAVSGALHSANNLLPRFIDLSHDYAWPVIKTAIFVAILIVTFALRDRITQQFNRLAHRAA